MAFTDADLQSAATKLASLDFTAAELEAIAATIRGDHPNEVSGFVFEPNDEPLWAKGFLPKVTGLVDFGSRNQPTHLVSMAEGETI